MAEALASSDSKNFWQKVNRVNKSKQSFPVSAVDGVSGAQNIFQHFSTKFRGTLNSGAGGEGEGEGEGGGSGGGQRHGGTWMECQRKEG